MISPSGGFRHVSMGHHNSASVWFGANIVANGKQLYRKQPPESVPPSRRGGQFPRVTANGDDPEPARSWVANRINFGDPMQMQDAVLK